MDAESREAAESVSVDRVRFSLSSCRAVRVASGEDAGLGEVEALRAAASGYAYDTE